MNREPRAEIDDAPEVMTPQVEAHRANSRLGRNIVVRAGVIPVSALTNLTSTAVILNAVGPTEFGRVSLLATLSLLMPFADLGLGASVTNAVSASPKIAKDPHVRSTIRTAAVWLTAVGAVVSILAAALAWLGLWPTLLGFSVDSGQYNWATCMVLVLFGVNLPLSLSLRLMQGAGRSDLLIGVQLVTPVVALIVVWILSMIEAAAGWYSLALPLGTMSASVVAMFASRLLGLVSFRALVRHRGAAKGSQLFALAAPAFVIMVGIPIALQTDRILLSYFGSPESLSAYAVVAQLYATGWGLVSAGGQSLWATFRYRQARGLQSMVLWQGSILKLAAVGSVIAIGLVTVGPWVVSVVSRDVLAVPRQLYIAFGVFLIIQSIHLPTGMLLTNERGMRFQAYCVVVMVGVNLPLSVVLIRTLGVTGPVVASIVAVGLAQLIPAVVFARRSREVWGG